MDTHTFPKKVLTLDKKLIHCIQHMKITYTVKVDEQGTKCWYHNDKLHRTDGPAVEYADGTKYWYVDGKLHRTDGPAVEYANGGKEWYVDGECHRTDGPAVEYANGSKVWYVDGKLHRTDGPAMEFSSGTKEWYVDGEELTEAQWRKRVGKVQCEGRVVEVDGVRYKLVALWGLGGFLRYNQEKPLDFV